MRSFTALLFLIVFLGLIFPIAIAQDTSAVSQDDEATHVDKIGL